jgi:hypothetical protein
MPPVDIGFGVELSSMKFLEIQGRAKVNRIRTETYCKGKTKKGKPCRAAATEGGLCFFHANPDKAVELGRMGGMTNRHVLAEDMPPLPKLDSATAVRDIAARLIADVYAGTLHPRTAASLAPLLHLQLRVLENINIEQRLAKLERMAKDSEASGDGSNSGTPGEIQ